MSKKLKAFGSCIGFGLMAYGAYTYQAYDPMKVCIALSLISLLYGVYKVIRDMRLRVQPTSPPLEQAQKSSSNNRLFVPPPLDK